MELLYSYKLTEDKRRAVFVGILLAVLLTNSSKRALLYDHERPLRHEMVNY